MRILLVKQRPGEVYLWLPLAEYRVSRHRMSRLWMLERADVQCQQRSDGNAFSKFCITLLLMSSWLLITSAIFAGRLQALSS
jgi:hypothetical protein